MIGMLYCDEEESTGARSRIGVGEVVRSGVKFEESVVRSCWSPESVLLRETTLLKSSSNPERIEALRWKGFVILDSAGISQVSRRLIPLSSGTGGKEGVIMFLESLKPRSRKCKVASKYFYIGSN